MEKDYKYYVDLCKKQDYERVFPDIEEMNNSKDFYKENGFHYEDTWNLDCTIIKFILPRLAYLRDTTSGYPNNLDSYEEWIDILNEILDGFESYLIIMEGEVSASKDIGQNKFKKAFELFTKYFCNLWD
jgi:hypothetical protein